MATCKQSGGRPFCAFLQNLQSASDRTAKGTIFIHYFLSQNFHQHVILFHSQKFHNFHSFSMFAEAKLWSVETAREINIIFCEKFEK